MLVLLAFLAVPGARARSRSLLTGEIFDDSPSGDTVTFEPTLIDQQCVGHGIGQARHGSLVVGLHGTNLDDFAVGLDVCDRERDGCIFHPEREALRFGKDEEHPGVFGERLPES